MSKGILSTPSLTKGIHALTKAIPVVNSYAKWVQSLPDSVANYKRLNIKDLTMQLAAAKTHAWSWQREVQPLLKNSASDIVEFSTAIKDRIRDLQNLIPSLQADSPGVKDEFVQVLKILKSGVNTQLMKVTLASAQVKDFSYTLEGDIREFEKDIESAKTAIVGDNSALKSLYDQLSAINEAINRDNGLIVGGILTIFLAIGGAADKHKQEDKKDDVEATIAQKKKDLASLSSFQMQYTRLLKEAEPVAVSVSSIHQAWCSLEFGIEEVISELDQLTDPEAADYLNPLLTTASKDWAGVLVSAQTLSSGIDDVAPYA